MTKRVGIISAAWGAHAHLPAWRAVPGVEVVGICTAHRETAEAAAVKLGIAMPFWDAADMARHPDIDIVDVGTRPSYRRDMCLAALGAGKHVYGGMPFAVDLAAARTLADAAVSAGTVTAVDAYAEHLGVFRFAEELLNEGALGTVQSVIGRLDISVCRPATSASTYNWFHDASFGVSALNNLGSHLLHLMVFLLGPVANVAGTTAQFVRRWDFLDGSGGLDPDVVDTAMAVLRFESGPMGTLITTWAGAAPSGFCLELTGDRGRLAIRSPLGQIPSSPAVLMPSDDSTVLFGKGDGMLEPMVVPPRLRTTVGIDMASQYPGDPRAAMARSFWMMTQAIDGVGESRPDFSRAHHVQAIIESIRQSDSVAGWAHSSSR